MQNTYRYTNVIEAKIGQVDINTDHFQSPPSLELHRARESIARITTAIENRSILNNRELIES